MPDVMFTGPEGRLEGRYHQSKEEHAPIALILHPHPQYGGTMNHKVVFSLFHVFVNRGFSVLRFNTRGVGRSQGRFDNGMGELSDAAAALDWLQGMNADAKSCWIAGYSFGAWIGMQLLMRRPEIDCFVSVSPPANSYDFAFLAPCPSSGLIVGAEKDHTITASLSHDEFKKQSKSPSPTAYLEFEGRPHMMMAVEGWEEIASGIDDWLKGTLAT